MITLKWPDSQIITCNKHAYWIIRRTTAFLLTVVISLTTSYLCRLPASLYLYYYLFWSSGFFPHASPQFLCFYLFCFFISKRSQKYFSNLAICDQLHDSHCCLQPCCHCRCVALTTEQLKSFFGVWPQMMELKHLLLAGIRADGLMVTSHRRCLHTLTFL